MKLRDFAVWASLFGVFALILFMLFFLTGCAYWKAITSNPEDVNNLQAAGNTLVNPLVSDVNCIVAIGETVKAVGTGLITAGWTAAGAIVLGIGTWIVNVSRKKKE